MSSFENYSKLVQGFCIEAGLSDSADVLNGGVIDVAGVNLKMVYSPELNAEVMLVYCDYGEVPKEKSSEIYSLLLRWNAMLNIGFSPSYGMAPGSDNVMYIYPVHIKESSPEKLWQTVQALADAAHTWRENNYFLDESQPADAMPHLSAEIGVQPFGKYI